MASIHSLRTLTRILSVCKTPEQTRDVLESYRGADWKSHVKIDPNSYNRAIVSNQDGLEVAILTWNHNQASNMHNNESICTALVLQGTLVETVYSPHGIEPLRIRRWKPDDCFGSNSQDYWHAICNQGAWPAVSLHVYHRNKE